MKRQLTILALLISSLAATAFGQQAKIEGYVSNDKDRRVPSVRIIVTPGGQAGTTDSTGHFFISLPENIQPGQAARIRVERAGWVIFNPMFGNCDTKSAERNYEPLKVVIVPKGSLLALSPKRISEVVAQWSVERSKQVQEINRLNSEVNDRNRELDDSAFLRKYAEEYGFTLDKFISVANQWAQIKEADDKEERALKEYWQENYDTAARLALEAGQEADAELEQANQQKTEASRKKIKRNLIAGNSFYAAYKFNEALAAYGEIEQRFETRKISKEDFTEEWAEVKLLVGNTKYELGIRGEGATGPRLLAEALAAYRQAETFYTREQLPQDWAMTQNNLGAVLRDLGGRAEGNESIKYLNNSVVAFRAALEVRTREQLPEQWAATQNNLGNVLRDLGGRAEGNESIKYLNDSVAAFHAALEVRTRQQLPQDWAITQNNLGAVLWDLGRRAEGNESIKYLSDSVAAFHAALEVFTRAQLPQQWAATQNNLGVVLSNLGERAEGSESIKYLNDSVAAFRAALEVYTHAQLPQDWAMTQNNLGVVLHNLGGRAEGSESIRYLNDSVTAYRAALEVRTRQQLPQDWAITQNNLGNVLRDLGRRVEGNESIKYLNDSVAAFHAALEVFTRAQLPQQWAATQNNLALSYLLLRDWADANEAYANILQAYPDNTEAYRRAASLLHEVLFKFDQAFALHQQWLARHKDDVSAQADFAETHFTTAHFSECGQLIAALLVQPEVSDDTKTALRAIEIASLLALNQSKQVSAKLDALIADVVRQPPAFKIEWSFDGTRYFISHSEKLSARRVWLKQLLDALASKDRDTMLRALQEVRTTFKE